VKSTGSWNLQLFIVRRDLFRSSNEQSAQPGAGARSPRRPSDLREDHRAELPIADFPLAFGCGGPPRRRSPRPDRQRADQLTELGGQSSRRRFAVRAPAATHPRKSRQVLPPALDESLPHVATAPPRCVRRDFVAELVAHSPRLALRPQAFAQPQGAAAQLRAAFAPAASLVPSSPPI
jgi:hypothetical protein